ncbi:unnamed protein product [Ostreobium quekettii]|uniref:Vanadium-dependent haloperoxidase NapH1-like second helical-bundle domain-containing protein n=1 Tax=Ostreobium quekettii TaxID=121088 RepID=A0A8S1JBS5_9CHLO|nr:unnamed protein product [Ostreobium quekettii]
MFRPDLLIDYVIDGAAYEALSDIFFGKRSFTKVQDFFLEGLEGGSPNVSSIGGSGGVLTRLSGIEARSFSQGRTVCARVQEEYKRDGFDGLGNPQGFDPEVAPTNNPQEVAGITDCPAEINSADRWQPICVPVDFGSDACQPQTYLGPGAHLMHTYGIPDGDAIRPPGPPLLEGGDEQEWRRQAREVLEFSADLNDSNKVVAEHWADGPDTTLPPGHLFYIAVGAAEKQGLDVFASAQLLFLVGAALNDAGVAAWASKLRFDYTRPLQMIQCGFAGEAVEAWVGPYAGVGTIDASTWQPYQARTFVTPPFPAYVSGHSAFSAAAAAAMIDYFGTNEYLAPKCIRYEEGSSLFEGRINPGENNHIAGMTDVPNQGPRTTAAIVVTRILKRSFYDFGEQIPADQSIGQVFRNPQMPLGPA